MKAKRAYLKEERIMEKIHINLGSDSYDVHIESGLIDKAGSAIADLTGAEGGSTPVLHWKLSY